MKNSPDFLIAGAAKSGSSTLYSIFNKHPEIQMSLFKEPSLFLKRINNFETEFHRQFPENTNKILGEATVEYMISPEAAKNILSVNPDIKLIFILRDPIKRAYSHYWHRVKTGEEERKFSDVIRLLQYEYPINYSLYGKHLSTYYNLFPRENIHVIILEQFKEKENLFLAKMFDFLEVPYLDIKMPVTNMSKTFRNKHLNKLVSYVRKKEVSKYIPFPIYKVIQPIYNKLYKLNWKPFKPEPIAVEDYNHLKTLFKKDIDLLGNLIGQRNIWNL